VSKTTLYSQLNTLRNLIHSKDLTNKSDCDKLLKQLKKAIEFLERKANL